MKRANSLKKRIAKMTSLTLALLLTVSLLGACKKDNNTPNSTQGSSKASSASKTTAKSKTTSTAKGTQTNSTKQTGSTQSNSNAAGNTIAAAGNNSSADSNEQSGQDDQQNSGNNTDGNSNQPASGAPEELKIDLGGKVIVHSVWTDPYVDLENSGGQTSALSVYIKRLEEAQQKYNFKLEFKVADAYTQRDEFINNSLAGVFYADLVSTQSRFAYPKFIKGNLILPVDEYYDFNSDAVWMSNSYFVDGSKWNGRYYSLTMATGGTGEGVVFNKDNLAREGLQDPYTLMNNGQWTWDTMLQMCQQFTKDVNGDGVVDTYGILAGNLPSTLVYSNGGRVLSQTQDGKITFGLSESNSVKALQFASDLWNVYKVVKGKASGGAGLVDFENVLFYVISPNGLTELAKLGYTNAGWSPMAKGPDTSEYQNVATASNIITLSGQTKYPKELVMIYKDAAATWDQSKPDYISPYDAAYISNQSKSSDPATLDSIAKYSTLVKMDLVRGFDGFESAVNKNVYQPIAKATTPVASAIESYRDAAQALIDEQN